MPVRIAIEGNIAAGKSTFLQILAEAGLGFLIVPEPISKWQSLPPDDDVDMPISASQDAGVNILDKFYSDQKRWAFTFQTYAFLSRLRAQLRPHEDFESRPELGASHAGKFVKGGPADDAPPTKRGRDEDADDAAAGSSSKILFFERSVLSDKYCFAANCRASGLFEEVEWRVYCDWWKFVMEEFKALRIDGLVYLRCAPATCHGRLQKRARDEEAGVPLEYLNDLHARHEEWLVARTCGREFPITTLVLDTDAEFETDPARRQAMVDQIKAFVASVSGEKEEAEEEAPAAGASASSSSGGAAVPGLGRRLSSHDGTLVMGEIEQLSVMRVGKDGMKLPPGAAADEEGDDVPTGPVRVGEEEDDDREDDGAEAAAVPARSAPAKGKGGIDSFFGKAR